MRKYLLLLSLLIGTVTNSYSQKNATKIYGTVLIDNNISMKMTEVTIQEWMCFIVDNNFDSLLFPDNAKISVTTKLLFDDLRKTKDFEYLKLIDYSGTMKRNFGAKGIQVSKNFKKLVENDTNYFSINIPVTGITYKQAQQFCEWKENLINTSQARKVNISLPSIDTYKKVITNKDSLNSKKCAMFNSMNCNCLTDRNKKDNKSQGKSLLRADNYWPTELGLYNLQGNASEMTNVLGIALGGSFRHYARQSFSDTKQEYSSAEDWLGFRYLITLR
jgi:formylglycine-generating enzyme required for sulfatase activity